MVLLPDYPTRVVNEHKTRVEKIALLGLLTIILGGAWWQWPAVNGEVDLLSRSSPVFLLFPSAILLSYFIDFSYFSINLKNRKNLVIFVAVLAES